MSTPVRHLPPPPTLRRPLLGVAGLTVFVLVNLAFYLGWVHEWFQNTGQTVTADFQFAGQVQNGDPVRLEGVLEGQVRKIQALPGARGTQLVLNVDRSAGPIYANATVQLRWKTLLGGAFYVAIDRGTPSAGSLGSATIPMSRTSSQVELEDVTSLDSGGARQGLTTLPGQLARALADPAAPARVFSDLAAVSPAVTQGVGAARGEFPDTDLRGLLAGTRATVTAVDAPDGQLETLIAGAAATLQTTASRDTQIEDILAQGPLVTRQTTQTLGELGTTLTRADRLVGELQIAAPAVAPTLRDLRPPLVSTDSLLGKARPLVRALAPTFGSLAQTADHGVPLINALQPSLDRVNDTILPYLGRKSPETGYSTTVMIGGTAAGFGGAASQMDQNGHYIRFPVSVGTKSVNLPCSSSLIDPTQPQLLTCESLSTALQSYFSYVPPAISSALQTP
jgi:ABC-type transporter Mla subunit MlaD